MKEAYLYKKLAGKKVQCQNCAHYCVIENGRIGICGTRENINGKLYTLNYGKAIAVNIDPIEKKPLFHFLPGTYSLSVAAAGCNFKCLNCQNWEISQGPKIQDAKTWGEDISPKKLAAIAEKHKLPSISYTYTEPAVFSEYALDTMKIAKKKGLKNIWVTNGFWSEELFEIIWPYLEAVNVDIKGFSDEFYIKVCGAKLNPVLKTLKWLKSKNIWIEITTLAIPGLSDSEKMFSQIAGFIKKELGSETPWHITRFSGTISWKLQNVPYTPLEVLKKAYKIGKQAGLKYVYIGNVQGLKNL